MKRVLALTAIAVAFSAQTAEGHLGNSNYRDQIDRLSPPVSGLSVQVLNFDNNLEVDNHSGKPVVIDGYSGEPYARILADGTVQTNKRSPAYYINDDRYATTAAPASANPKDAPEWVTLDRTGRFEWHDHRIHLFTAATPKQVTDKSKTTKIFDWTVPIAVDGQAGAIVGTLFWHGQSSGFPVAALVSLVVIGLVAAGVVLRVRRRRDGSPAAAPMPADGGEATKVREAW